ncbi:MAG: S9 family peptidase [Planctomycetes bacterium]|nr:S9 family peptidase [Planctomycetota bacterium]
MFSRLIRSRCVSVIALVAFVGCSQQSVSQFPSTRLVYPRAKKVEQIDDLHGTKIADPYRWMEDLDSPDLAKWVAEENKVTFGYLNEIPSREKIRSRLTKVWNYERYMPPFKDGGRYFISKNDGLQNQNVVYTMKTLDDSPSVLLDPNKLSADGTVALGGYFVSDDGKYVCYAVSEAGSDWQQFRVRDIETGKDTDDMIKWSKFSGAAWTKDGKGFFYSRYDEPKDQNMMSGVNYFQKLYYHKIGTPQAEDELIYKRDDQKEWGFGGGVTEDGKYLVISVSKGTERKNRVFYKDLQTKDAKVVELLNEFDAEYDFIENDGTTFYFKTDYSAPRGRVIAIDITKPERKNWKELIPQSKDTMQGVGIINDKFVVSYLKDAYTQVKVYELGGKFIRDVDLPGFGTASGFSGKKKDTETFYSYTGFATPATVYRYDLTTGKSSVYKKPTVDFNSDDYVTRQVFYSSKDGTQIPMFITHRKDVKLDGNNPTYLYGYGGFNIPITPTFSPSNLVWMEMGGVFAVANLRGGGEYGKEWHDAGRLKKKQNVFDDFISAGEWLIANKYTSKEKLAIGGGSNGGLLVGACITQRPDLFAAAVPAVGVMDMLRFHKFTIGWGWTSDYGSPDNPEDFKVLRTYSPLHNIKTGTVYPATMITTGDHDDRVVPSHSFKFAATLQEAHAGKAPVLIRVDVRAGHGAGKPTSKKIEEETDKWGFLVRNLKVDEKQIRG